MLLKSNPDKHQHSISCSERRGLCEAVAANVFQFDVLAMFGDTELQA